tara:strand:- start:163 stop:1026 length:864 start_codon:yes stop_codon:yes gene_type:complete
MKKYYWILFFINCFLSINLNAQIVSFTNPVLKNYLINELCFDTDNDGFPDSDVDINNDNEIQISEADSVFNLTIVHPGATLPIIYSINEVSDLNNFPQLKNLTILGGIELYEISGLTLNNLTSIDVSDHNTITSIDLSGIPNLNYIRMEGNNNITYLNLQNGSYAPISLFYTYIDGIICVDSIATEYNIAAMHMFSGQTPTINCTTNISEEIGNSKTVYPNPTTGKITLKHIKKIDRVNIFDLRGKLVFQTNNGIKEIDISGLNEGLYFMNIHTLSGTKISVKIIKQ